MTVVDTKVAKKQLAAELFDRMLVMREAGEFGTNKEFRAATIKAFQDELGVSGSSACTMYNVNKTRACEEDPALVLGRDPKKVKTKVTAPKTKVKKAKVPVVVSEVDEDDILDRKTVNDTSGAVDLDPISSLYDVSHANDYDDLGEYTGNGDVGGGDYM